jgi:hypothetical protein
MSQNPLKDRIGSMLGEEPQQTVVDPQKRILDMLGPLTPEDDDPLYLNNLHPHARVGRVATTMLKGLGLGLLQGVTELPAGIGSFLYKYNLFNPAVPGVEQAGSLVAVNRAAAAEGARVRNQLATGIFSSETRSNLKLSGQMISANPMGMTSGIPTSHVAGGVTANLPDIVASTPETLGHIAGSAPGVIGSYMGASKLAGVGLAKTMQGKMARHITASTASNSAYSYLMAVKDGESEWMRVARDAGLNAAFEFVGLPYLKRAWAKELGSAADSVTRAVADAIGEAPELAALKITQVRAGAGAHEPKAAEAVLKAVAGTPAEQSPLAFQAKKALAEYWDGVVPSRVSVDATRGPQFGVQFDVHVNGKLVAPGVAVHSSKQDHTAFAKNVDRIAARIVQLSQEGHSVRLDNVQVAHGWAWTRFARRLRGERAQFGKMDSRALTEFEKNLGTAAPRGTLAESGARPAPGSKVTVREKDRAKEVAIVKGPGATPNTVEVENPVTGATRSVATRDMQVFLYEKNLPVRFTAHSDGTPRHMYFDLNAKEAFVEEVDAHTTPSWFRDSYFTDIDRDGVFANGPRGFVHEDGGVTLSIVKGERLSEYPGDVKLEAGPKDVIEGAYRRQMYPPEYRSPAERVAHNVGIGDVAPTFSKTGTRTVALPKAGGGFETDETGKIITRTAQTRELAPRFERRAGANPRALRDEYWAEGPSGELVKVKRDIQVRRGVEAGPEFEPRESVGEITAAARTEGSTSVDFRGGNRPKLRKTKTTRMPEDPVRDAPLEPYAIDRTELLTEPELIDARDAAKLMLQKNMDPATPVRVVITDTMHGGNHKAKFTWTVEQLAHYEPGLFPLHELRVAAVKRGYKAIPDGEGVILKDVSTGGETKFQFRAEAANFLQKQRQVELGPKIEAQANRILNLGWMQSFDAAVDGGDFVPRELQLAGLQDLAQNKRGLTKVWIPSDDVKDKAISRAEAAKKATRIDKRAPDVKPVSPKAAWQLEAEARKVNTALSAQLTEFEKKLGLTPGTLKAIDLGTQGDKTQVAIYNDTTVRAIARILGPDLERLLGVNSVDPGAMLRALSAKPAGLDIFSAPDPESALLYAWAKNTGQRELMLAGQLTKTADRVYRIYPPQIKGQFLQSTNPAAVNLPAMSIVEQNGSQRAVELDDVIRVPDELNLDGVEPGSSPPIMSPHGVSLDEIPDEKAPWKYGLSAWHMPRMHLFQRLQRDTGVPFYDGWSAISDGRARASAEYGPFRQQLDKMRWKVRDKGDRENVYFLFEALAGGKTDVATALGKKMSLKHVAVAENLKAEWEKFLVGIGFTPGEMQAFFAEIPAIRKHGGDFRGYTGMRSTFPKIVSFLKMQLDQEMSPIRLDEKATDFYNVSSRLAYIISQEKHVTPVFNEWSTKIAQWGKDLAIPPDIISNFEKYLHNVKNTPDDVYVATARTVSRSITKADEIFRRMTKHIPGLRGEKGLGAMTEQESIDVTGMLASIGYAADLAYNPASFIQQFLQLHLAITPALGFKGTKTGIKYAARWMRDPVLQADMKRLNIAGTTSFGQPFAFLDEATQGVGFGAGKAAFGFNKFVEFGGKGLQLGDEVMRVIAYMGKHEVVREAGEKYIAGKMDWETFRKEVKLDLMDWRNGPVEAKIKQALDEGNWKTAAHVAGDFFQKMTNFNYTKGDTPRMLNGTLGRFFFRYGNWPISYANYVYHLASVGEKKLTVNRAQAFATLLALSAGVQVATSEMFDAEGGKWAVWHSFGYKGGPFLDMTYQAAYLVDAMNRGRYETDPKAKLYMAELQRRLLNHSVPGSVGAKRLAKVLEALANGDAQGAGRALSGLEQAPQPPAQW